MTKREDFDDSTFSSLFLTLPLSIHFTVLHWPQLFHPFLSPSPLSFFHTLSLYGSFSVRLIVFLPRRLPRNTRKQSIWGLKETRCDSIEESEDSFSLLRLFWESETAKNLQREREQKRKKKREGKLYREKDGCVLLVRFFFIQQTTAMRRMFEVTWLVICRSFSSSSFDRREPKDGEKELSPFFLLPSSSLPSKERRRWSNGRFDYQVKVVRSVLGEECEQEGGRGEWNRERMKWRERERTKREKWRTKGWMTWSLNNSRSTWYWTSVPVTQIQFLNLQWERKRETKREWEIDR